MDDLLRYLGSMPLILRLVVFVGFAIVIHLVVIVFRHFATLTLASQRTRRYQKLRSLGTLATSAIVFSLYFLAIRFILR